MKSNLKLAIILLLCWALILTVSACSGSGTAEQQPPSVPQSTEPVPAVEVPVATAEQPVEAPAVTEPTAQPKPEQALDGQKLVETRCSTCHSLDRVTSAKKSAEDWASNVKRMVSKGAELSDAEQQAAIQYLSETYK